MYTPTLYTQKIKDIIMHLKKTVQMFIYIELETSNSKSRK